VDAIRRAEQTLRVLKKTDRPLDVDSFVTDKFIRQASQELGLDYDAQLKDYSAVPFNQDAVDTHAPVADAKLAGQVWLQDEPTVRLYSSVRAALSAAGKLQTSGKKIRVIFAHDRLSGIKLFAERAWFVERSGNLSAFLLKADADKWAKEQGGTVMEYTDAQKTAVNGLARD
jgi:NitT/TauT family transport system substrate-binding protein